MNYKEVTPEEFNNLYKNPDEQETETLYAAPFESHFEVMDQTVEYANFIFDTQDDARTFVARKYSLDELSEQIDLFQII